MADIAKIMLKNGPTVLEADEDYLATSRVLPKGSAIGIGVTALGGVIGGTLGSSMVGDSVDAASEAIGSDAAPQMAFGLTARRIIVWKCSPLSGKPTDVIGEIGLDSIASATFEKGLFAGALTLGFADGKTAEFTMVKVDKAQRFAEALQSRL
jgi:hypothetical protein